MSHSRVGFIAGLAVLPVYFVSSPPFVTVPGVAGGGNLLHWGLALGPLLVLLTHGLRRPRIGLLGACLSILAFWLLIALILGQFAALSGGGLALAFFIQLVVPAAFFLVGLRLSQVADAWKTAVLVALRGLTLFQLLLLLRNFDFVVSGATHAIAESFPQFLTYYPGLLALGIILAVTQWRSAKVSSSVFVLSVLMIAPAIWSRIGLAVISIAILSSVLVVYRSSRQSFPANVRALTVWIGVVGGGLAMVAFLAGAVGGALGQRLEYKGGDLLASGRGELMVLAMERILDRPVLGDAGRALHDRSDFGGTAGLGLRLFPSHSQYLDLGIRGGILALILGVAIAIVFCFYAWRAYRAGLGGSAVLLVPTVSVMLSASISDLYFSQALTAVPGWLMLGLGLGGLLQNLNDGPKAVNGPNLDPSGGAGGHG